MGRPLGRTPDELQRLVDEAQLLQDRLHRVTLALTLSEEAIADTYDRLADAGGPHAVHRRVQAERARAFAEECRRFASRLDDLG